MKAKVLASSLPLPCLLCLGYIWGIGVAQLQMLGLGVSLIVLIILWGLRGKASVIMALCGGMLGFWWCGQALLSARVLLEEGALQKASSLEVTIVQAAERAGDKVIMTGRTDQGFLTRIESRSYFPALPGDIVSLRGSYSRLEQDEESTFNYPLYLAKNGLGAVYRAQEGRILQQGPDSPTRLLAVIRRTSLEQIARLWPGDVGGLIAGILVGARGSFSEELVDTMRVTGLMHIVAVSGFNMTILINAVLSMTGALAMRWRVLIATILLILFTLFVGPSGAVVRACLMGVIALIAKLYARPATAFLCLVYAATAMLVFSPLDLLYDIGFQLSFVAVLGLLWGEPAIARISGWLPGMVRSELQTTMAAILWTLPISVVYFGNVSLIAPIANLVVPPSIPILMLGGFSVFVLSWIPGFSLLAWPLAQLVQLWTTFLLWISTLLGSLPFAAAAVTIETAWALPCLVLSYALLALWSYRTWAAGRLG